MKNIVKSILIVCVLILSVLISSCNYTQTAIIPPHRLQWWLEDINWDSNRTNYTGNGIRIAVIDSGVDFNHPDLKHCIEKEIKVSSLSNRSSNNDVLHGTAVAGIIAGYPSSEKGVLGVAPNSHIISIDVTDDEDGKVSINSLIEGINLAKNENVDIISISVGIQNDYQSLHDAIKDAYNENIIIVASAGNFTDDKVLYPSSYEEVICVGSKSKEGNVLFPKNYDENNIVYLPGENIVTALPNGEYGATFGTSVSVPILTGTIALMLEANPKLNSKDIYCYFSEYGLNDFDVLKCIKMK